MTFPKQNPDMEEYENGILKPEELAMQRQMVADFNAALRSGDKEEAERIARDFLSKPWSDDRVVISAASILSFIERSEATRREKEGHDAIRTLWKCHNVKRNRQRVREALQTIDQLQNEGWSVCPDDSETIDDYRARLAKADEYAKQDREWQNLCGKLEIAVKAKDLKAVRMIMSLPEFQKRHPYHRAIEKAEHLLDKEDDFKRRARIIGISVLVIAITVISVYSIVNYKMRLHNEKCETESEVLNELLESCEPIERLSYELNYLQSEEPEIFVDPRIYSFRNKLRTLTTENISRTNEIAALLNTLQSQMDTGWQEPADSVTGKFERIQILLKTRDTDYAKQFSAIKANWNAYREAKELSQRNQAQMFFSRLQNALAALTLQYKTDITDLDILSLSAKCDKVLKRWDTLIANKAPDLDEKLKPSRLAYNDAKLNWNKANTVLTHFKTLTQALEIISTRTALVQTYSFFPDIAALQPLPYSDEDVFVLLTGSSRNSIFFAEDEKDQFSGKSLSEAKDKYAGAIEIVSAGKIQFDPTGKAYKRDKKSIVLSINENVPMNSPIYILRKNEDGTMLLKRAIVAPKGKWGIVSNEIKNELIPGEPLFRVK